MAYRNQLSDHDMVYDLLTTARYMSGLYDQVIVESGDSMVCDTFETLQDEEHRLAQTLSGMLRQQGRRQATLRPVPVGQPPMEPAAPDKYLSDSPGQPN